jgi:hypothetical protein
MNNKVSCVKGCWRFKRMMFEGRTGMPSNYQLSEHSPYDPWNGSGLHWQYRKYPDFYEKR